VLRKVTEGDPDMLRVFETCARTWGHLMPKSKRDVTIAVCGKLIRVADQTAGLMCQHRQFTFTIDIEILNGQRCVMLSAWEEP
jgi:hypothetical protein